MTEKDTFKHFPEAMKPHIQIEIDKPHLLVYSGVFTLQKGSYSTLIDGAINYSLNGRIELVFEGTGGLSGLAFFESIDPIIITTPNGFKGECVFRNCCTTDNRVTIYRGIINHLYSAQKDCYHWQWLYLNMEHFHGELVVRNTIDKKNLCSDRLTFCCTDGTEIILDNVETQADSNCIAEYHISHCCKLTPSKGKLLDYDSTQKYIVAFSHFISFVVGRYHSPIFIEGIDAVGVHHSYHNSVYDRSHIGVNNWLPFPHDSDIKTIWPIFEDIWNGDDTDKADILSTAIHWYLEANTGSGKIEGALIMAITGIQLMCNVILPKDELGNQQLQNLIKRMNYTPSFDPQISINARNQLIHYYEEGNRQKYSVLTREEKIQSLEIALNVLELAILYWLGYQGRYADRMCTNKWQGASTKRVPWATSNNE